MVEIASNYYTHRKKIHTCVTIYTRVKNKNKRQPLYTILLEKQQACNFSLTNLAKVLQLISYFSAQVSQLMNKYTLYIHSKK